MISNMKSYLVDSNYKMILEADTRKKMRRISRKKYPVEYKEKREYIIISGNSLKEALSEYKLSLSKTLKEEKIVSSKSSKKASKPVIKKLGK